MIYGIKAATELAADLIIEKNNNTYVCIFDPSKVDHTSGAPDIESQEIWQISLYHKTEVNGATQLKTLYPDGSNAYRFAPNNINSYTFKYRL